MESSDGLKKWFEDFKKTKYAVPISLILTFVITCAVLVTTYYMCFSYAAVSVIAFGIPYYFGLKSIKKLAVFGITLFLFLGLAFGVYSFYEWKGMEGKPVGSESGLLTNGTMTRLDADTFQYSVFVVGGNGSEEVRVVTESQWAESVTYNLTLVPLGPPTALGQLYVNNTTLPEGLYFYHFELNAGSEWLKSDYGIGPINISDGDFLIAMLFSRIMLVFLNIALLYYILLGLIYWSKSSRKRYEEIKKEKEEPRTSTKKEDEQVQAEEKFVCSECGAEVPPDATECPQCGEPFEEEKETMICGSCGAEVDSDAESCWNCGKRFAN